MANDNFPDGDDYWEKKKLPTKTPSSGSTGYTPTPNYPTAGRPKSDVNAGKKDFPTTISPGGKSNLSD